jgi:hypothetical protein
MQHIRRFFSSCLRSGLAVASLAAVGCPDGASSAAREAEGLTQAQLVSTLAVESLQHIAQARGSIAAKRFAPAWESIERTRPLLETLRAKAGSPLAHTEALVLAGQKALEKKDFLRADSALEQAEDSVRTNILALLDEEPSPVSDSAREEKGSLKAE